MLTATVIKTWRVETHTVPNGVGRRKEGEEGSGVGGQWYIGWRERSSAYIYEASLIL